MNIDNQIRYWAQMVNESVQDAEVYYDDGSHQTLNGIVDIYSFVQWKDSIHKSEPEGDMPIIKKVIVGGKTYLPDDIERVEMEMTDDGQFNESVENMKLCDVDTLIKRLQVVSHKSSNPPIMWIEKDEKGYPAIVYSVGAGAYDSISLAK